MVGRDERKSEGLLEPSGVFDDQETKGADFHGQISTLWALCSLFIRAEGFLDAFRC